MNKKIKREQWDEIQIAFDRRSGLYVAYSTETDIVATGVCVQSAVSAYKEKFIDREMVEEGAALMHSELGD